MLTNIPSSSVGAHPIVHWTEGGEARSARWRSESGAPPARRVVIADDHITADDAYGLACQGTALLWRGGLQNTRHIISAVWSAARPHTHPPKPRKAEKVGRILDAHIACRGLPSPSPGPVTACAHVGQAAGAARRGVRHSVATCARRPTSLLGSLRPGR